MNLGGVSRLPRRAIGGHWFRAIKPKYVGSLLDLGYTVDYPSRYSPGVDARGRPFTTLYLADDPIVALREVEAIYGNQRIVPNPQDAWCLFPYEFALTDIVDLTDPGNQSLIEMSLQEITGPWQSPYSSHGQAPTQQLGETAFRLPDIQGIVFPSARGGGLNILIFPEKVTGTAWIRCKDATGVEHALP